MEDPRGSSRPSPTIGVNKAVLHRLLEPKQYTSFAFGRRCEQAGIVPSMGSAGDPYDNAMVESFFATRVRAYRPGRLQDEARGEDRDL